MQKPIKVAYVVSAFPAISEAFLINQIADLIDRGCEVHIYATQKVELPHHKKVQDYNLLSRTIFPKVNTHNRFLSLFFIIKFVLSHLKWSKQILKFLIKKSPSTNWYSIYWLEALLKVEYDVIHAHFGNNGLVIADFKNAGFLEKTPLLTTFHGYDIHESSGYPKYYERLKKYGDLYTVNSDYTLDIVLGLGFSKEKIYKLPVGLDTSYFKPHKIQREDNETFYLLFIGRLVQFKAPDLLIPIVEELIDRGKKIKCVVVGGGFLEKELVDMIKEKKLSSEIELKGGITQSEIIEIMNSSDTFILPGIVDEVGRAENQGLVIQEAQAMELPVIVSDAGGMKEGMLDGETGFVVKEKDIIGFVSKIERLIDDPDLRFQMAKNARQYVINNFDVKELGNRLETLYKLVIKKDCVNE